MNQMTLFDEPEDARGRPPEPIVRTAEIVGDCRRTLKRAWGAGPYVAWCGMNPSDADAQRDDPTVWQVMKFSYRLGYGGAVVVNLFPHRTPDVTRVRIWRATWSWDDPPASVRLNIYDLADVLGQCDMRIAAWGNLPEREDVTEVLSRVEKRLGSAVAWHCLGTASSGAPKHPLARGRSRIPPDAKPIPWRWRP